jgi:pilus assembly protein CpaB
VVAGLTENEAVMESKLAPKDAGAGLPAMIPPNMRAVSVQVNDVIAVAGFVIPGTHVDVLVTGSPSGNNMADAMTTTVLENVEVLAAGQKIQPNSEGKPEKVPVITLLVSPEDAQRLTLASNEGKIQLSLRNPLDRAKQDTAAVKTASLYRLPQAAPAPAVKHVAEKTKVKPAMAAVAPPPYTVEVIRGDKRDTAKFASGTDKNE